jgi:hypothetical protein
MPRHALNKTTRVSVDQQSCSPRTVSLVYSQREMVHPSLVSKALPFPLLRTRLILFTLSIPTTVPNQTKKKAVEYFQQCDILPSVPSSETCQPVCSDSQDLKAISAFTVSILPFARLLRAELSWPEELIYMELLKRPARRPTRNACVTRWVNSTISTALIVYSPQLPSMGPVRSALTRPFYLQPL